MTEKQPQSNKQLTNNSQLTSVQLNKTKNQILKQYWTQHRITLIAYQAQYIRNKAVEQDDQQLKQKKPKQNRKKINLQYQSGFLFADKDSTTEINILQIVKNYDNLRWLFENIDDDQDYVQVRQFIKIMLELKHQCIIKQFLYLYNQIIKEIRQITQFQAIQKQQPRQKLLTQVKTKLIKYIQKQRQKPNQQSKFPFFLEYLKNDRLETQKLINVQFYCFLAERFNFNINQYYSQAFSITLQDKSNKKIKTQSWRSQQ